MAQTYFQNKQSGGADVTGADLDKMLPEIDTTTLKDGDAIVWDAASGGFVRISAAAMRQFRPHESSPADMNVQIEAGVLLLSSGVVSQAAQAVGPIAAPVSNPRIDRIVLDQLTGAASIVAGTEAATPVAPAVPAGKIPLAQVYLTTATAAITDSLITYEMPVLWNEYPGRTAEYVSTPVAMPSAGGVVSNAHPLGSAITWARVYALCVTAANGWNSGAKVPIVNVDQASVGDACYGFDSNNINLVINTQLFILDGATGALTGLLGSANWKLGFEAFGA